MVATDQDTKIVKTVGFTFTGSSDDFIVHLKQFDTDIKVPRSQQLYNSVKGCVT